MKRIQDRFVAALLAGAGLAPLPAALPAHAQAAGWISVAGCAPAAPLVPSNTTETCGSELLEPLQSGLVRTDAKTGAVINEIAETIETSDNRTWRVTVRKGWSFHDGTQVTAKSFVDAWNWAAYAPNGQANNNWYSAISGYDDLNPKAPKGEKTPVPIANTMSGLVLVDELRFDIHLKTPNAGFLSQLTYDAFAPLPSAFFADPEAYGRQPIGAGPFRLESGTPDSGYRLSAFLGYLGTKPALEGIEFRFYTNKEAAYNDLVAGNLDLMRDIPPSKLVNDQWKSDLDGRVAMQPRATIQGLGMPWGDANPQLAKSEVRQAVSMAIDRKAIVDIIFSGAGQPATGWVPPGVDGYRPGGCGDFCNYDPDRARALLAAAGGYSGDMKIYYAGDSDAKPAMDAICNSIQNALGISCVTSALSDNATFRSLTRSGKADGPFPANWTMDYPSISNALIPIYSSTGSSNRGSYSNPEFDALLARAANEPSAESIETYRKAESLLANDLPRIPLWNPAVTLGHSEKIKSVTLQVNGRPDYTAVQLAE